MPFVWHLLVRLESKGGGVRESHFFLSLRQTGSMLKQNVCKEADSR